MPVRKKKVTSGVNHLDKLLGGGIIIGDNVVWYDDAGSLAPLFCQNLIKASQEQKKSLIYICFDHSPKNLLEKLGPLSKNTYLTILDCFTNGKGEGADIFQKFYRKKQPESGCRTINVDQPHNVDHVTGAFYGLHKTMKGDVRFIFDSLTGMQGLWGGEDEILKFYSHACPRLYELNTIAYWIIENEAHSQHFKAHINKITQVAIDLSLKRGKTTLSILKADKRNLDLLNKPASYWNNGLDITFDAEGETTSRLNLGNRLKELRTKRGFSQTEIARLIGVTPSTISQVENNQIYPSLPALIKMSEILSVDLSSLLQGVLNKDKPIVFPAADSVDVHLPAAPKGSIKSKLLIPEGFKARTEPYIIDILAGSKLPSHFFNHKGEEVGYVLSGELRFKTENGILTASTGDLIYLTSEMPTQWENSGVETASLLWLKVK